ncbi:MAG: T9SS type A sorting domain-containing protein, partial [Ferruginibacter sp.]
ETSDNGVTFSPVQTIPAGSGIAYGHLLEKIVNQGLTVRIKAESVNGQYVYSDTKTASTTCNNNLEVFLYPNPVAAEITELTLRAKTGIFNGKYNIHITDVGGAEVKRLEATFSNQVQVKLQTGKLAAGIYLIVMTGEDGQQVSLKMVRL